MTLCQRCNAAIASGSGLSCDLCANRAGKVGAVPSITRMAEWLFCSDACLARHLKDSHPMSANRGSP